VLVTSSTLKYVIAAPGIMTFILVGDPQPEKGSTVTMYVLVVFHHNNNVIGTYENIGYLI